MSRCALHDEEIGIDDDDRINQGSTDPEVAVLTHCTNLFAIKSLEDKQSDHHSVENALHDRSCDKCGREVLIHQANDILSRVRKEDFLGVFLIENGEDHDREGCERNVVELVDDRLIQGLSAEGRCETIPELWHNEKNILVKHVNGQDGVSTVGFATMVEKKWLEEGELGDCVVGRSCSLHAL